MEHEPLMDGHIKQCTTSAITREKEQAILLEMILRTPTKIYIDWISRSTTNRIQKLRWLIRTTITISRQWSSTKFQFVWSVLDRMEFCSYRSMSQDTIFRSSRQIGRSCNLSNNLLSSPNVYYSGYTGCEWQGNRCKVNDDGSNGAL